MVAWADVSGLVANKRMRTPAGHPGVIVEAVTPSRTHRFVVPSENPDGLEYEVTQLASAVVAGPPDTKLRLQATIRSAHRGTRCHRLGDYRAGCPHRDRDREVLRVKAT